MGLRSGATVLSSMPTGTVLVFDNEVLHLLYCQEIIEVAHILFPRNDTVRKSLIIYFYDLV